MYTHRPETEYLVILRLCEQRLILAQAVALRVCAIIPELTEDDDPRKSSEPTPPRIPFEKLPHCVFGLIECTYSNSSAHPPRSRSYGHRDMNCRCLDDSPQALDSTVRWRGPVGQRASDASVWSHSERG